MLLLWFEFVLMGWLYHWSWRLCGSAWRNYDISRVLFDQIKFLLHSQNPCRSFWIWNLYLNTINVKSLSHRLYYFWSFVWLAKSLNNLTQNILESKQKFFIVLKELTHSTWANQFNFDISTNIENSIAFRSIIMRKKLRFKEMLPNECDKVWIKFNLLTTKCHKYKWKTIQQRFLTWATKSDFFVCESFNFIDEMCTC